MSITLFVRTIVPVFWLGLVSWVLGFAPVLEPLREPLLAQSEIVVWFVSALLLGAWAAFASWLSPKLPAWLSRLLMGSTKVPQYETIPGEFVHAREVIEGPDDGLDFNDDDQTGVVYVS